MTKYMPVRVISAPGYEDFDGWLILSPPADWAVRNCVVGFYADGRGQVAVIPEANVVPADPEYLAADYEARAAESDYRAAYVSHCSDWGKVTEYDVVRASGYADAADRRAQELYDRMTKTGDGS